MIENSSSAAAQQKLQRQSNHAGGSNALAQSSPAHAPWGATRNERIASSRPRHVFVRRKKCQEAPAHKNAMKKMVLLLCCSGALHQEIAPQNAHPLRQDIICQKLNAEVRQKGSRHRAIRTHTCFQTYKNATLGKCTA